MLRLPPDRRALLEAWSRAAYPNEACGVLIGERCGGDVEVHRVVRAPNLESARPEARFELDPAAIVAADAEARARGHELVGVWHSHPDGPARPSAADRRSVWPGWAQVIVGVERDGTTSLYPA